MLLRTIQGLIFCNKNRNVNKMRLFQKFSTTHVSNSDDNLSKDDSSYLFKYCLSGVSQSKHSVLQDFENCCF